MPQEHSFRHYLEPLRHHSILLGVILVAALAISVLAAAIINGILPYEAEAVILLKASGNDRLVLTNGTEFRDTTLDTNRLAQSMQVLAASADIAQKVQVRGRASTDGEVKVLAAGSLIDLDRAVQVSSKGDLIYIHATATTPAAATWLANTWADEALAKINQLYAVSSSNVDATVQQARATLDADEAALQQFLVNNPMVGLTQQLTQTEQFLQSATTNQTTEQFTLYDAEHQAIRDRLTKSYAYIQTLDQLVPEIQALRTRIDQSADDPGSLSSTQVALLLLPDKMLSGDTGTPLQLQFNLADIGKTPLSKADQLRDVDATLAAVEKLQGDIRTQIADLEGALQAPRPGLTPGTVSTVPPALQNLIQQRNQLESAIEQKKFELAQLQKTRDLDQNTYDLLRSRLAEQQLNATITRVADLGVSADDASTQQSRSFTRTLAWVTGQGLLLAVVLALGLAYALHVLRPEFNSNASLRRLVRRSTPDAAQAGGGG